MPLDNHLTMSEWIEELVEVGHAVDEQVRACQRENHVFRQIIAEHLTPEDCEDELSADVVRSVIDGFKGPEVH